MKGQVSAEMLILLAVVIAIVAIAATYLLNVGERAGESVTGQTEQLTDRMEFGAKGNPGDWCNPEKGGADCKSGRCGSDYKCE